MCGAVIAESGNRVALQVRVRARLLLISVVGVKTVCFRKFMEKISTELIGLYRARRRPGEYATVAVISCGNKREKSGVSCSGRAIGKRSSLRRREHIASQQNVL